MSPVRSLLRVDELQSPDQHVTLGALIAEGTYSVIHAGKHVESGDAVAIKMVNIGEGNFDEIEEELRVLRNMSVDSRIPKFYGIFKKQASVGNEQIWLVMELCSGGTASSLAKRIKAAGQKVSEDFIAYILHHLVQVLCHLHRNHFIHRDIRGSNILLTSRGHVKLVDFGTTFHMKSTMDRCRLAVGAPYWMSPEVIMCDQHADTSYDVRSDVWSTGITAIELADGQPPLWDVQPVQAMFQITRNPPPTPMKPAEWSQNFLDFLSECLERNMENRPIMDEISQHPFISEIKSRVGELQSMVTNLLNKFPNDSQLPDCQPYITTRNGYLRENRQQSPYKILVDDLVTMDSPTVVSCTELLCSRFRQKMYYTFVADVLLAINPYCDNTEGLYDNEAHKQYAGRSRSDNRPHIFSVADKAMQDAIHNCTPQSIVCMGESGSGKSFNVSMALRHLCHIGRNEVIGRRVLAASWVIDLFSSASSSGNSSSTRHIRLSEVTFTKTGRMSGAIFWVYMLETGRLVDRPKNDGTFNALYAYFFGLKQAGRLGIYRLSNTEEYRLLPKHRKMDENSYADQFRLLEERMDQLDISKDSQETVRKIMSAILLMAELQFKENDNGVEAANKGTLSTVAFLLSVDESKLEWSLCNTCCHLDGQVVKQRRSLKEAERCRDSVVQILYCRLVDSIVNWINASFTLTRLVFGEVNSVNLLDMTGFDSRSSNGLSQLIINSFNEQINCFFGQCVFAWEMEDYQNDGVDMDTFHYTNNAPAIDMLMKRETGLLSLLDQATLTDPNNDDAFIENCRNEISSDYFTLEDRHFSIAHFKGKVQYSTENIVSKNKDCSGAEMFDTMRNSENPAIGSMFSLPLTKTGNLTMDKAQAQKDAGKLPKNTKELTAHNKRFDTRTRGRLSQTGFQLLTTANRYRYTAMEVLHKLINSSSHFVHCIKSNTSATPTEWDNNLVSHQLQSLQLLNTINIRKHGFPQRPNFAEFLRRYKFLAFDFDENVEVTPDNCRLLLVRLKVDGFLMGKDRVFLKYYSEEFMSRLYEREVKKIAKIQAAVRAFLVRKRKKSGRSLNVVASPARYNAAVLIQTYYRRWRARTMFQQLQLYRVYKHHQLIVFCQQVHVYSQEFFHHLNKNIEEISIGKIQDVEEGCSFKRLQAVKVFLSTDVRQAVCTDRMIGDSGPPPLDKSQRKCSNMSDSSVCSRCKEPIETTFDFSHEVERPSSSMSGRIESPSDQRRSSMARKGKGDITRASPLSTVSFKNTEEMIDERQWESGKSTPLVPVPPVTSPVSDELSSPAGISLVSQSTTTNDREESGEREERGTGNLTSRQCASTQTEEFVRDAEEAEEQEVVNSLLELAESSQSKYVEKMPIDSGREVPETAYNRFAGSTNWSAGRQMIMPAIHLKSQQKTSVVHEMRQLGIQNNNNNNNNGSSNNNVDNNDQSPFNFQSLLRKTTSKRESMKRRDEVTPASGPSVIVTNVGFEPWNQPKRVSLPRSPIFGSIGRKSGDASENTTINQQQVAVTYIGEAVDL